MEITDFLTVDRIEIDVRASSKKQVLNVLAQMGERATGISQYLIFDTLLFRERLGTTGVGNQIAIPHGKLPGLDRVYGTLCRLEKPIDFDAIDDHPVDILFMLLAPEEAGADHLKALARIARVSRDTTKCQMIREAKDPIGIYEILTAFTESRAA
jgi:PTS system nitrogen regulatory IIA component